MGGPHIQKMACETLGQIARVVGGYSGYTTPDEGFFHGWSQPEKTRENSNEDDKKVLETTNQLCCVHNSITSFLEIPTYLLAIFMFQNETGISACLGTGRSLRPGSYWFFGHPMTSAQKKGENPRKTWHLSRAAPFVGRLHPQLKLQTVYVMLNRDYKNLGS